MSSAAESTCKTDNDTSKGIAIDGFTFHRLITQQKSNNTTRVKFIRPAGSEFSTHVNQYSRAIAGKYIGLIGQSNLAHDHSVAFAEVDYYHNPEWELKSLTFSGRVGESKKWWTVAYTSLAADPVLCSSEHTKHDNGKIYGPCGHCGFGT